MEKSKYVFIVTLGRTGSSLLVHILNKFEELSMLGETPDVRFIIHISNLIDVKNEFIEFKSLTKERGMKLNSPQTTHPYYNIANEFFEQDGILENDFDELISKLHSNFLPDNKISGSKILMSPIEQGEKFEKHFKNISSLKNVKFLFLTRDVNQTFKSMQKVKWPNTLEQVVQEMG